MPYLRWRDDGTPAAGKFEGWPKTLAEFTMLDPCCGSGHFLVAAFNLLVPLRMHDETLSAAEACDAVLQENLHGLELDPRCTQIARRLNYVRKRSNLVISESLARSIYDQIKLTLSKYW
jgi:hypothetical protein